MRTSRSRSGSTISAIIGLIRRAAIDATVAATAIGLSQVDVGDADAFGWYAAQLVAIRWLQGHAEEILPMLSDLVHSPTVAENRTGFVAAVAALAAAADDRATARAALASLRVDGLQGVPSSSIWSATMLGACEAAYALGDCAAAAEAYELLAPFADLPVMASLAVACFGSAHRPLGLAALTMGDVELAIGHFEAAVVADLAIGNLPCHTIARAVLADALDRRDGAGDAARATELRRAAIDDAIRFGMTARAEQWERRLRLRDTSGVACRREGRIWHVGLGEHMTPVPHSVGMEYLSQLIAHPGVEIEAVALANGHAAVGRPAGEQIVLDAQAKARYRRHIGELRHEIDDAEACADLERAARARVELDRFLEQLAQATGFAGRTRSFADDAERARVSVSKAIKRALAVIAEADSHIGREIGARVLTGRRCMFRPVP